METPGAVVRHSPLRITFLWQGQHQQDKTAPNTAMGLCVVFLPFKVLASDRAKGRLNDMLGLLLTCPGHSGNLPSAQDNCFHDSL